MIDPERQIQPKIGSTSPLLGSAIFRLFIIIVAALTMLAWSWQTWPDALVDFGTQLYVPWQMACGKVLYRDFAYYNGPLSQYLNAALFALFGVSIQTLVAANLAVLVAALLLIYWLADRVSGPIAATMCALTFVLLFAFGQGVGIGNYNWVTPYTNEITHGIALGLLSIALLQKYWLSNRRAWLGASGVVMGLVFLTKAEPFVGTAAAIAAMLIARAWARRQFNRQALSELAVLVIGAVAVVIVAVGLMSIQMPLAVAVRGAAGSWPWAFDRRITALPFYRSISGVDDIAGNIKTMLWWLIGYGGVAGLAVIVAFRSTLRTMPAIVFFFGTAVMLLVSRVFNIDWNSMIRPLPLCLLASLIGAAWPILRRTRADDRAELRLGLIVFAMAIVAKIALNVHVYHYGFALAMPCVLVTVAGLADDLPQAVNKRGGNGNVIRAAGAVCWCTAVLVTLYVDHLFFSQKSVAIGAAGDTFYVDGSGAEVKTIVDRINDRPTSNATLVVLPQGLMVNYLTRRTDPIPYLNFMPPEVLAVGENRIIAALAAHPPDLILVDTRRIDQNGFTMDHSYHYGFKTLDWVRQNYVPASMPPARSLLRLVLMIRRP